MSLYDAISRVAGGRRHLAEARLRYRVLGLLHEALERAGMTQSELAEKAGLGKSAVSQVFGGNGNLRVNTIAAYLDAMDCELKLDLVEAGTARAEATEWETPTAQQRAFALTSATESLDRSAARLAVLVTSVQWTDWLTTPPVYRPDANSLVVRARGDVSAVRCPAVWSEDKAPGRERVLL